MRHPAFLRMAPLALAAWAAGTAAAESGTVSFRLNGSLAGHRSEVTAIAVSRNGARVIAASEDGTLRVWKRESLSSETLFDQKTPAEDLRVLARGHIGAVALTADGKLAVSALGSDGLALWDVDNRRLLRTLASPGHAVEVYGIVISTDDTLVLAGGGGTNVMWEIPSGREVWAGPGAVPGAWNSPWTAAVAYLSDSRALIGNGGHLSWLDVQQGVVLSPPIHAGDDMPGPEWGPMVVSTKKDFAIQVSKEGGSLRRIDLGDGTRRWEVDAAQEWSHSIALSPDGRLVVIGGAPHGELFHRYADGDDGPRDFVGECRDELQRYSDPEEADDEEDDDGAVAQKKASKKLTAKKKAEDRRWIADCVKERKEDAAREAKRRPKKPAFQSLIVWDASSGRPAGTVQLPPRHYASAVAFTHQGALLIGTDRGTILRYTVARR